MTTADVPQNQSSWRKSVGVLAGFFGLFAGLCTIFALVVTGAEGWQEHTQALWPEATAHVQRCGLDIYTYRHKSYWIDCSVSYVVRGDEIVSHIHSHTTPAPRRVIGQYPSRQYDQMQQWVDEHPEGTAISVHYDPAHLSKAVLVATDMPLGGPQTPNNLKLLGFFAALCVVLLAIARIAWPRSGAVRGIG
ncbi:MAG TPA: DUF3592 domain-containing protein [Candidatus Sulfotelmatobacter sp.]|jgi:hypothetical protein|nr:DUF3592 domain-containing protein [Candidatus Sulfotelmatobacter sp.]